VSIPQAFVQELISRVDIVEVVGRFVQLKKGGANFMGLCPFHGEKSPSFTVSPSKQFFHCFGCGKNGNAIGFLMEHTGVGFVDAVKDLAQQTGLQVPEEDLSPQDRAKANEQRQKQHTLVDVLEKAAEGYRQQLKQSQRAIAYFKQRGLSGQIAKTFGLGYAPEGWRYLSTVFPDYQSPLLTESGLVIATDEASSDAAPASARESKRYDRFRDRVMFPIRNVKGECIGFGGRVLDKGEPKYLNSPETPVFSKGHELYGLFEARSAIRSAGYALVTEGYMDVVALAQLGFANAVATLGTACTADHVRKLFRFTDSVVFSFDGDAAGRRAARKALDAALPWATDTRSIKFLFLPAEHDPDSYIREHGPDAFAQCVKEATPLSRFLVEAASADCDLETAEGRAKLASQAQPLWTSMPDGALKRQLLGDLAEHIGLDPRELDQLWQTTGKRGQRTGKTGQSNGTESAANTYTPPAAAPSNPYPKKSFVAGRRGAFKAQHLARGLLGRPDIVARIVMAQPTAWDWLAANDHPLLGHLPEPHGPLFAWLESQWHEHGPQPWAALREAMRGQPFEALAVALNEGALVLETAENATPTEPELRRELRELMRRLHIEDLKMRETLLIGDSANDPSALQRYRELQMQRKKLEEDA
jgi:DNA primase